jgi:hypothetical protein
VPATSSRRVADELGVPFEEHVDNVDCRFEDGARRPGAVTKPDDETMQHPILELADPIRTVRLQRRLDAPPYRVYRAWSAPEALSEWFP